MTNNDNTVPQAFRDLFRKVVAGTQPRSPLMREACEVYFETLSDFSMEVLQQGARRLLQTSTFFPSAGEWFQVAAAIDRRRIVPSVCQCGGRGLLVIRYHSGEPFDIAICTCPAGIVCERTGEDVIRTTLNLPAEHRIAFLEDFD